MRFAVPVFPGSNCDVDCAKAVREVLDRPVDPVWHTERNLENFDAIILPGGFSYGDYLRTGALARFSPVMESVAESGEKGKMILGICNGFQVLLEAGLLPGAMRVNDHLQFRCAIQPLRVENNQLPFTRLYEEGEEIHFPIAHGEGNYYCDPEDSERIGGTRADRFPLFRGKPQWLRGRVSPGVVNAQGNVLGLMPHPERATHDWMGFRRRGPPVSIQCFEPGRGSMVQPKQRMIEPVVDRVAESEPTPVEIRDQKLYSEMGLASDEYQLIIGHLGRLPNWTELGIYSVMWSEHCSYKNSKPLLRRFPGEGTQSIAGTRGRGRRTGYRGWPSGGL